MSCDLHQGRTKLAKLHQSLTDELLLLNQAVGLQEDHETMADSDCNLWTEINEEYSIGSTLQGVAEEVSDIDDDDQTGIYAFPMTHSKQRPSMEKQSIRTGVLFCESYRKQVYVELTSNELVVSNLPQNSQNAAAVIIFCARFDIFMCQVKMISDTLNVLARSTKQSKEILFSGDAKETILDWFKDINWCIAACENKRLQLAVNAVIPMNRFYEKPHLTMEEFEQEADTLDLVFFVGSTIGTAITRVVCRSEYDHIALVLRSRDGKIFLLEAGYTHGVSLYTWEKFKEHSWKDTYSHIVFRKMRAERTQDRMDTLDRFVKSVVGRRYEITLAKLFRKRSIVQQPEAEVGRTFFCSELIAAAYKRMGFISQTVSAAAYMPGDFAEGKLNKLLVEGEELDKEKVIFM